MSSITITRPVLIKIRVTDGYKKAVAFDIQENLSRLQARLEQINTQHGKFAEFEKKNPQLAVGGLQQIEAERQKIFETSKQLNERLKEVGSLNEGQEIVHGRVESMVEIKVGDSWGDLMSSEVVLEDGKVIEIRQEGLS